MGLRAREGKKLEPQLLLLEVDINFGFGDNSSATDKSHQLQMMETFLIKKKIIMRLIIVRFKVYNAILALETEPI